MTPRPLPRQVTPRRSSAVAFYLQAVSPESRLKLKLKRSKLEMEKEEIDNRLFEHKAQGSTKFKATMLDGAITAVEKLLT